MSNIANSCGITNLNSLSGGRLTLTSGDPVGVTENAVGSTIYYTPYLGASIALFNTTTSAWMLTQFTEVSYPVAGFPVGVYDMFGYLNGGMLTLASVAWTNSVTRAFPVARQDGILVSADAPYNRYLGTFYLPSTGQCSDSDQFRYLWNNNNRIRKRLRRAETTQSWNYGGAFRIANGNPQNTVAFVQGFAEDAVECKLSTAVISGSESVFAGIGFDTVAGPDLVNGSGSGWGWSGASVSSIQMTSLWSASVMGFHTLYWLEGTGTSPIAEWTGLTDAENQGLMGSILC